MKNFIKSWLPVLLWAAIIFFFSSNPDPYRFLPESWRTLVPIRQVSGSSLAEWLGQILHFVEYAVLSFLLMRAFRATTLAPSGLPQIVVLVAMAFALSDEIHQIFVPGRTFQVIDLLIDLLGILFGVYLYTKLKIEPRR